MRQITVFTHGRPEQTARPLEKVVALARERGLKVRLDSREASEHEEGEEGTVRDAELMDAVEMCVVLGGDGTILRALRRYVGTGVPVFAVNYGEIGFLASSEAGGLEEAVSRALDGEIEVVSLPAITLAGASGDQHAVNDIVIHRPLGDRLADIQYGFDGEPLGGVRCDGMVVATPAGSTGYNLSNGGPIMAWGVEGFVVSFIAPHTLTARALVVGPDDRMVVRNRSRGPLTIIVDGRPVGELGSEESVSVALRADACTLAQLPGSSFYQRLRERFDRLAR